MVVRIDTDVDFRTEVYPVCRDETVGGLVRVFLWGLVTSHSHVFPEDAMFCSDVRLLSVPGRWLTKREAQQKMPPSA